MRADVAFVTQVFEELLDQFLHQSLPTLGRGGLRCIIAFPRAKANIISRFDPQVEAMETAITMFRARVVTQNILLREIRGELIERHVELVSRFGKIHGAASL